MSQVKLRIPRPKGDGGDIVGILQRSQSDEPIAGRPITLLIHGILSHKDQSYHKLLATKLAEEMDMDTFRYDLRDQGGESISSSEDNWGMANFDDDVDDLEIVLDYLRARGYFINTLVAHSRGAIFAAYYLCTRPHIPIPYFVNVSGRYFMMRLAKDRQKKYESDFVSGRFALSTSRTAL